LARIENLGWIDKEVSKFDGSAVGLRLVLLDMKRREIAIRGSNVNILGHWDNYAAVG